MRHWAYLFGGLCWLCAGGAAGRGYLPAIGPSPVRFLSSSPPPLVAELPSIAAMTAIAVTATNVSVAQSSPPEVSVPESELGPEPEMPLVAEKPTPPTPSSAVATNSFVPLLNEPLTLETERQNNSAVLESLVSLFKHNPGGTNRLDPTLLLPLNVLPAPNSKPPSSTAKFPQ